MRWLWTIPALIGVSLAVAPAQARPALSRSAGCPDGALRATALASPRSALAQAGVSIDKAVRVVTAVEVPGPCGREVGAVFSGGVITTSGEAYEWRGDRFVAAGQARRNAGDRCPPGARYSKCVGMVLPGHSFVGLAGARAGGYVDAVTGTVNRRLLSAAPRDEVVDITYLPVPDAGTGGNVVSYVKTPRGGYFLILFPAA